MSRQVLLISLGPVQDFIAAARRSRDFWFGSWMLSDLAKATARGLLEVLDSDVESIVFPAVNSPLDLDARGDLLAVNRIVAWVPSDRLESAVTKARGELDERMDKLREEAFGRIRSTYEGKDYLVRERAVPQVKQLVEFDWVAVAAKDESDYARALENADLLLAARKRTRIWGQPTWSEPGVRKSSIDGERESALLDGLFEDPVDGGKKAEIPPDLRRVRFGVRGDERLCGVGLLKRHGRWPEWREQANRVRFFSTSHVSALPFMLGRAAELDEPRFGAKLRGAWEEYRKVLQSIADGFAASQGQRDYALRDCIFDDVDVVPEANALFGHTDGSLLYAGRVIELLEEFGMKGEPYATSARSALQSFLQVCEKSEPSPYFAILHADGDRMGSVIRCLSDRREHRAFSLSLSGFAGEASRIVSEHNGSLIYSGGDDVLAFVPLHRAVECAYTLAARFKEMMGRWTDKSGASATLSAGLAIVHHTEPMDVSLDIARRAERIAKDDAGRNALCVTVAKRGGAATTVYGTWDELVPRLLRFVAWQREDAVSDKAAHELANLASLTARAIGAEREQLLRIQKNEALRILRRKTAAHGQSDISPEVMRRLEQQLDATGGAVQLGNELYVAALIAKAREEAERRDSPQ